MSRVVGDECIIERRIEMLHPTDGYSGSGGLGKHLEEREHYLMLEIILVVDFQQVFLSKPESPP